MQYSQSLAKDSFALIDFESAMDRSQSFLDMCTGYVILKGTSLCRTRCHDLCCFFGIIKLLVVLKFLRRLARYP